MNVPLSIHTPNIVPIVRQNTNNNEQHSSEDTPCEETNSPLPTDQNEPQKSTHLRRSQRERKSAISNDYVVYWEESDLNVGIKNDPVSFSQAMECYEHNKWIDAMKDELKSMEQNKVWNLVG